MPNFSFSNNVIRQNPARTFHIYCTLQYIKYMGERRFYAGDACIRSHDYITRDTQDDEERILSVNIEAILQDIDSCILYVRIQI